MNALSAWPNQAATSAMGTLSWCIRVPQVCRASCNRMCGTPAYADL
ncbi:hypothetical protein [Mycobacterium kyorinense]